MHDHDDDDRIVDLDREVTSGEPPVPGAQWDELRQRWERWDEVRGHWVTVGDELGEPVLPPDAIPSALVQELLDEDDDRPHIIDVDRLAAPSEVVPGAQWNEVVGRWERWDDAAGAWVDALAAPHDTSTS